jgi:phage baseplate assembly protein gpV/phage protein D
VKPLVLLPHVQVEVGGAASLTETGRGLRSVRVHQRFDAPSLCEMVFSDPPGPLPTGTLHAGDRCRVGIEGHAVPLFVGEITAVEHRYEGGSRELRVRGYDLLRQLRTQRSSPIHTRVTVSDLARQLTASLGIRVEASEGGPSIELIIRRAQNDLQLLLDAADRAGLHLALHDDVLHVLTFAGVGVPIPLTLGEMLLRIRVEVNTAGACHEVEATGWDPILDKRHHGRATQARSGREIGVDTTSVAGETRLLLDEATTDDAQATALAQAELDDRVARDVIMTGLADGDPRLRPGTKVAIRGIAPELEGVYVLADTLHSVDEEQGFVSRISSRPLERRARPATATATVGIVVGVDDPEHRGRVQVSLPTYGDDVESAWMPVICPGAGPRKGLEVLPDKGDHVLLLLVQGEAASGVVLGGIYGAGGPPADVVHEGGTRRYVLQSAGGQQVSLDDVARSVTVAIEGGSRLELAPEQVTLRATANLLLDAAGHSIRIRAKAIDLETA